MNNVSLSTLCTAIIDCPHSTPQWCEKGIPVIRNFNLIDGAIDQSKLSYVDEETYNKRIKRAKPEAFDIIFSREASIGAVGIIPRDFKCCLGQRLVLLKVNKERCNPYYLLATLQSNYVKTQLQRLDATGSIVSNVNIPDLKNLQIPFVSSLEEQNNIANLFMYLNEKIRNNQQINYYIESLAKTIYDYWFIQFDFPDENGRPYKSSGGKMVWNERLQREIPDGWEVDCLGNHIKIDRGISYSSDELMPDGIPMINLNSFHSNSTYKVEGIKKYSGPYKKINLIQPYDLLICMTQQSPIDITGSSDIIGKAIILPDCFSESEVVMSMDVARLKCDQKYGRYYLKRLLDKDFFHKYMVGFASGTKIKHLHINGLMEYSCEIPDSNLIRKYNQISYNIYCKISEIIKENQQLASLRDFLLPLLMNGQVSFKSDSI